MNRSAKQPCTMPRGNPWGGLEPTTGSRTRLSPPLCEDKVSNCGRAQDGVSPRCSMNISEHRFVRPARLAVTAAVLTHLGFCFGLDERVDAPPHFWGVGIHGEVTTLGDLG